MKKLPQNLSKSKSTKALPNSKWVDELVAEAAAIEAEDAKRTGEVGFMARMLVQASMPHSPTKEMQYQRSNGMVTVSLTATVPSIGLPYGPYPRLLLCWLTTEAVRTKSPQIELGRNLAEFMEKLSFEHVRGGARGNITLLKKHLDRFFTTAFRFVQSEDNHHQSLSLFPVEAYELWWDSKKPRQGSLWSSNLLLNQHYFKTITTNPVPVDMRILRALARLKTSMGIDIYTWLTYRVSYLKEPTKRPIPWPLIQQQMGAGFDRVNNFRKSFLKWLKVVQVLYPALRIEVVESKEGRNGGGGGLILKPCRSSVIALK